MSKFPKISFTYFFKSASIWFRNNQLHIVLPKNKADKENT
jgi:hypothetical protein